MLRRLVLAVAAAALAFTSLSSLALARNGSGFSGGRSGGFSGGFSGGGRSFGGGGRSFGSRSYGGGNFGSRGFSGKSFGGKGFGSKGFGGNGFSNNGFKGFSDKGPRSKSLGKFYASPNHPKHFGPRHGRGHGHGHYSHRRHYYNGIWWDYGVGSCWEYDPEYDEYYWVCD